MLPMWCHIEGRGITQMIKRLRLTLDEEGIEDFFHDSGWPLQTGAKLGYAGSAT